jgi:hypothetical protein
MAQNPFYPGYAPKKPGESPGNPMYPGYYPGKAVPKRKFGAGAQIGEIPNLDIAAQTGAATLDFLDDFTKEMEKFTDVEGVPRWIKERWDDDFKSSLKINVKAPKGFPTEKMDEYDMGALPGGGYVALDLNPENWNEENFEKTAKKTLKGWAESTWKLQDYVTKARQEYWQKLITPDKPSAIPNEYSLKGLGVYDKGSPTDFKSFGEAYSANTNDVYAIAGSKLVGFYRDSKTPVTRDTAYQDFLSSGLHALSTEIGQSIGGSTSASIPTRIDQWRQEVEMAGEIKALDKARGDLAKAVHTYEATGGKSGLENLGDVKKGIKDLEDTVKTARAGLNRANRKVLIDKYGQDWVNQYETHLNNLEKLVASKEVAGVKAATGVGIKTGIGVQLVGTGTEQTAGTVRTVLGHKLAGGDALRPPSLHSELQRKLSEEACDINSEVYQYIEGNSLKGRRLINHLERASTERDIERNKELYTSSPSNFLERYLWSNRIGMIGKSDVSYLSPKTWVEFGFNQVQNFGLKINEEKFVSSEWYKKASHVYDKAPNLIFGNRFNITVDVNGRGVKMGLWGGSHFKGVKGFQTWFDLEKGTSVGNAVEKAFTNDNIKALFTNKEKILEGVGVVFPIDPKKIGSFVKGLNISGSPGSWVITDAAGNVITVGKNFLNLDIFAGCKNEDEVRKMLDTILKFQGNAEEYRAYLIENVFNKIPGVNIDDPEVWRSITKRLANDQLNEVTRRYLGLLEKLSKSINKIQNLIYAKVPGLKFLAEKISAGQAAISTFINGIREGVKNAIKKYVAAEISKLAGKFALKTALNTILQAIAGLADVIAPIIGHLIAIIVAWVIDKIIGLFTSAFKSFVKFFQDLYHGNLDFAAATDPLEKEVEKARKLVLAFAILMFFIIMAISGIKIPLTDSVNPVQRAIGDPNKSYMNFLMASFSPTDPTRQHGSLLQSFDWNIYLGSGPEGLPPTAADAGISPGLPPNITGFTGTAALGPGIIINTVNCFQFSNGNGYGDWPQANVEAMTKAIGLLNPVYAEKLCSGGDIILHRNTSSPGWCGEVISPNDIVFFSTCSYGQTPYTYYLFAHETGHIYHNRFGVPFSTQFAIARSIEGSLPTYSLNCGISNGWFEDFAETIGDMVAINQDCGNFGDYTTFWKNHPRHKEYAEKYLFGGL